MREFSLLVRQNNYLTGKEVVLPSSEGCLHIALFTWYFLAFRNLQCLYFFLFVFVIVVVVLDQISAEQARHGYG